MPGWAYRRESDAGPVGARRKPITAAPGPGSGNAGVGRFGSGGGTPGWADRVEGEVGPSGFREVVLRGCRHGGFGPVCRSGRIKSEPAGLGDPVFAYAGPVHGMLVWAMPMSAQAVFLCFFCIFHSLFDVSSFYYTNIHLQLCGTRDYIPDNVQITVRAG